MDEAEIRAGESLYSKIGKAIDEEVDFVIAVFSKNSLDSEWVQREIDLALHREFEERKFFILPLLLEQVQIHPFLKSRKYIDATTPEKANKAHTELIETILAN